jgi:hypothetical protein
MVATYEGVLRWDNAQAESSFDSDWCMNLYTPHGVGVSGLHDYEPWIHTEVDPKNVGDGFDRGFWMMFRDNIHNGQQYCGDLQYCSGTTDNQNKTVAPMINGKRAILFGLLGLDMGHDEAGAELHPVYGTAIHTGGRTLKGSGCDWSSGHCKTDDKVYLDPEADPLFDVPQNPNDDTWAIWVANYGSEGYCSTRALHVLDGDDSIIGRTSLPTLSFRLPWAKDAAGRPMEDVQVLDATNFALHAAKDIGRTDAIYDVAINRGASIIVTFHMWPSDAQPYWFGELHLKWQHALGPLIETLPPVLLTPSQLSLASHVPPEAEDHPLMTQMSPTQKEAFLAEMKKALKVPPMVVKVSIVGIRRTAPPPPPPPVAVRASVGKTLRLGAAEEDAATRRALCATFAGHVPNQPTDFCQQTPR